MKRLHANQALAALLALCLALCLAAGPARAGLELEDEQELAAKVKAGELTVAELVRRGEELSYWQKLKLWLYSQELAPHFEGLEDAIRALAKQSPADPAGLQRARQAVAGSLALCKKRLWAAGRENPQRDWQRGLSGIIFLDNDWRRRVAKVGSREIKNPFDLVALFDCLEPQLNRPGGPWAAACPRKTRATEKKAK